MLSCITQSLQKMSNLYKCNPCIQIHICLYVYIYIYACMYTIYTHVYTYMKQWKYNKSTYTKSLTSPQPTCTPEYKNMLASTSLIQMDRIKSAVIVRSTLVVVVVGKTKTTFAFAFWLKNVGAHVSMPLVSISSILCKEKSVDKIYLGENFKVCLERVREEKRKNRP